jgi:hypothetical protein
LEITKQQFADLVTKESSTSLRAYITCPVCCSTSYDICVSTIKQLECRRYEDFVFALNSGKEMEK